MSDQWTDNPDVASEDAPEVLPDTRVVRLVREAGAPARPFRSAARIRT
mgnify:CR=1 FL=1